MSSIETLEPFRALVGMPTSSSLQRSGPDACATHKFIPPTSPAMALRTSPFGDDEEPADWSEEDVVLLHLGLLAQVRRLTDPETPLEEKLDTLSWVFTDERHDLAPFSFAQCLRVAGLSPMSPLPYCGKVDIEAIRDWIALQVPRWLKATLDRYPAEIQQLVRQQPQHVERELTRDPQWLNREAKRLTAKHAQADLFAMPLDDIA